MTTKARLLIVEDDVDLIEMLSAYFRVQNFEVITAGWGEDAIQLAKENSPELILLDIRLPDIDGYEVCRRLRLQRTTQHVPVIFLTERRQKRDILAGLELGAVDYVTKPFDIQELRLRVRNALRRGQRNTLVNPVTNLPDGTLVRERLDQMLQQPDWGIVLASLAGLAEFRSEYGFVAADDVARAISLMLANALSDSNAGDSFIGHLDLADFVILTKQDHCRRLAENCRQRLDPAIPYFYPVADRNRAMQQPVANRLAAHVQTISAQEGDFATIEALGEALNVALT